MAPKRRLRWVHPSPLCLLNEPVGIVIAKLQYLGMAWAFIMLADLPLSLVAYGLAWK